MSRKVPHTVTEIELTYYNKLKAKDRPQITRPVVAYKILEENWSHQMSLLEEFNMLLLDRSNRVMSMIKLSKGGRTGTVVDLKIAFAAALKGLATGLIIAHNHPSGNLKPSEEDINLTEKFKQAGEILDIVIYDHIILSPDGEYYSFSEHGLM